MAMRSDFFLDIPTRRGLIAAGLSIIGFLGVAYVLYIAGGKSSGDYGVKLADYLLQGAIVSLLFAILKAIIDVQRSTRVSERGHS